MNQPSCGQIHGELVSGLTSRPPSQKAWSWSGVQEIVFIGMADLEMIRSFNLSRNENFSMLGISVSGKF